MDNETELVGDSEGLWLGGLIESGSLSISDRVHFNDHLEVAKLFGRTYKGHQSATIRLDGFTEVWFPKMYPNGDWDNTLSPGGQVITMRHVPGGKYGAVMETKPIREYVITFGHIKPSSGPRYYQFLGVYEGTPHLSDNTKWVHQRVSDTVTFDGNGDFSFEPTRTRPIQDDQTAEAADADPKLVAAYQEKFERGFVRRRGSGRDIKVTRKRASSLLQGSQGQLRVGVRGHRHQDQGVPRCLPHRALERG